MDGASNAYLALILERVSEDEKELRNVETEKAELERALQAAEAKVVGWKNKLQGVAFKRDMIMGVLRRDEDLLNEFKKVINKDGKASKRPVAKAAEGSVPEKRARMPTAKKSADSTYARLNAITAAEVTEKWCTRCGKCNPGNPRSCFCTFCNSRGLT